jgi:hypothetical protein
MTWAVAVARLPEDEVTAGVGLASVGECDASAPG